MTAYEWLGQWEDIPAPGKHTRMDPAMGAFGYPAPYHGQVLRAITADGTVGSCPSWERSPQVLRWMQPERKTVWQLIKEWMVTPYGR